MDTPVEVIQCGQEGLDDALFDACKAESKKRTAQADVRTTRSWANQLTDCLRLYQRAIEKGLVPEITSNNFLATPYAPSDLNSVLVQHKKWMFANAGKSIIENDPGAERFKEFIIHSKKRKKDTKSTKEVITSYTEEDVREYNEALRDMALSISVWPVNHTVGRKFNRASGAMPHVFRTVLQFLALGARDSSTAQNMINYLNVHRHPYPQETGAKTVDISKTTFIEKVIILPANSFFEIFKKTRQIETRSANKTRFILSSNFIHDVIRTVIEYGPDPEITEEAMQKSPVLQNWNSENNYSCFMEFYFSTYHIYLERELEKQRIQSNKVIIQKPNKRGEFDESIQFNHLNVPPNFRPQAILEKILGADLIYELPTTEQTKKRPPESVSGNKAAAKKKKIQDHCNNVKTIIEEQTTFEDKGKINQFKKRITKAIDGILGVMKDSNFYE